MVEGAYSLNEMNVFLIIEVTPDHSIPMLKGD